MHITLHTIFYTHTDIYFDYREVTFGIFIYISKNDKLKTHIRLNLNSIYMGNILFVSVSFNER